MKSLFSRWLSPLLISLTLVAVPFSPALAIDFHVNPVRLELNEKSQTTLLTVHNQSPDDVRLQVSTHTWAQDALGQMELAPTRDLSLFPSLLTLKPGQSRHVRVGMPVSAAEAEKTYRVVVEQLPSDTAPGKDGIHIQMRTRMSIPLFVAPKVIARQGRVEDLALREGRISFALRNSGTMHLLATRARVRGEDSKGHTILDKEQAGWYVLAGDERQFSLDVPGTLCRDLRKLSVEVRTDNGTLPAMAELSGMGCAP
jgi:fimbrial chaperone protein